MFQVHIFHIYRHIPGSPIMSCRAMAFESHPHAVHRHPRRPPTRCVRDFYRDIVYIQANVLECVILKKLSRE